MMLRKRVSLWLPLWGLLTLALLGVSAVRGPSAEAPANQQQITDLEKQIQELTQKLEELRRAEKTAALPGSINEAWVKTMTWRCIGPASMGGRIVALSVFEADPSTYWVATASGGLLKTTNNGVTFEHQFDKETTVSLGDVCVAPSDKNLVWVGTGENNPRNSVSYGDGVYKSIDSGKTWKNMGLKKTFQIGRVVVHPKNPDIVYVGALGRLYGPNEERGLYKTIDGGKTWQKIHYLDDKTGVIDIQMHPSEPETLLVATWERQRDGFDSHPGNEVPVAEGYDRYDPIKKWGPGSGVYKTTDGGKNWKKITAGLPSSQLGRMALDYYRKDPRIVYAVIDCQKIGMGLPPPVVTVGVQSETADGGIKVTQVADNSPAAKASLKAGDLIKVIDKKEVTRNSQLFDILRDKKAGDKLALSLLRGGQTVEAELTLTVPRADGGGQGRMRIAGLLGVFCRDAEAGPTVFRVMDDTAAAKAGLQEGDLIKALDKKPVRAFQEMIDLLNDKKPGDKVTLQFVRANETKEVTLTLADPPQGFGTGPSRTRPYSYAYGGQLANVQDQQGPNAYEYGGVFKSTDGGDTWTRINSLNPRPMYFSQIRVDPSDDKYVYVCGISLHRSNDGGKTFRDDGGNGVHPDQHALWINPKDGRHMIVGCDGGFYATYDRMAHWDHLNHQAIGQFYHVAVDNRRPYRAFGGLQDNGSWGGPSHSLTGAGAINEDWMFIAGGDGFVCRVDPNDPDLVYYESQDGNLGRRNLRTGEQRSIRARPAQGAPGYRFNWNTPFILSSHNPRILYCAGNHVFRSLKQGDDLRAISPEITRTKRGSATAVAESPRNPDVLYAGTDDGFLWVTRDGGNKWTNVTEKINLPGPRWVATIEPSRTVEGRCYVVFDGHRSDDDEPHVYVTEDFGQSWKSLRSNLPAGSTRCLREDISNPNLLYLGTEFAAWVSLNRGESWTKLNNNLPTVAIHEFAIHPTAGEIVAATHGRSLWVLDVTPLRQMTRDVMTAKAHLYEPSTVIRWRSEPARLSIYGTGSRRFFGENPPAGAQVFYSLNQKADKISLKVVDIAGKTVRELPVKNEPGLHKVAWDLTRSSARPAAGSETPPGGSGPPRRGPGGFQQGQPVAMGTYRLVLTVDGQELTQNVRVEADPTLPSILITPDDR